MLITSNQNQCVDVPKSSAKAETKLDMYSCNYTDAQVFGAVEDQTTLYLYLNEQNACLGIDDSNVAFLDKDCATKFMYENNTVKLENKSDKDRSSCLAFSAATNSFLVSNCENKAELDEFEDKNNTNKFSFVNHQLSNGNGLCITFSNTFTLQPCAESLSLDQYFSDKTVFDQMPALDVYLAGHTHDDVGWLKSVDEYYRGLRNDIQWVNVRSIIDSIVGALYANKYRRYTYVEMAFFSRWFNEQTEERKEMARELVRNKQLEFVNCGWSMSDEANPSAEDMVLNMVHGANWLSENLDFECHVGWHIDPFGHSAFMNQNLAKLGYDSFVFARIDYQDFNLRIPTNAMEMHWNPSGRAENAGTFTHVMIENYTFPFQTDFDDTTSLPMLYADTPWETVSKYFDNINYYSSAYSHNKVLIPVGTDFTWRNATFSFQMLDGFIDLTNKYKSILKFNPIYATVNNYFDDLKEWALRPENAKNVAWPEKTDDFFPYADGPDAFWTGYFTSRSYLKQFVRFYSFKERELEKMILYTNFNQKSNENSDSQMETTLYNARDTLGIMQHHDAVAGTEKQAVSDNYQMLMDNSIAEMDLLRNKIIKSVLNVEINISSSFKRNYYYSEFADNDFSKQNLNVIFNNLRNAKYTDSTIIPVNTLNLKIDCNMDKFEVWVYNSHFNYLDASSKYAIEILYEVEANSMKSCKVEESTTPLTISSKNPISKSDIGTKTYGFSDQYFTLNSDLEVIEYTNQQTKVKNQFHPTYKYFNAYQGDGQKSGAYIFRPINSNDSEADYLNLKTVLIVSMTSSSILLAGTFYYEKSLLYKIILGLLFLCSSGLFVFNNNYNSYDSASASNAQIENDNIDVANNFKIEGSTNAFIEKWDEIYSITNADESIFDIVYKAQDSMLKLRIVRNQNEVRIDAIVGNIDIADKQGKEVILNIDTDVSNGKKQFTTDTNGLGTMVRQTDFRATWDYEMHQPVAGNYYPIGSFMGVYSNTESDSGLWVSTNRAMAGSIFHTSSGSSVQYMLNRRLTQDDGRGVGEALNEMSTLNGVTRGLIAHSTHYATFDSRNDEKLAEFYQKTEDVGFVYNYNNAPMDYKYESMFSKTWGSCLSYDLYLRKDDAVCIVYNRCKDAVDLEQYISMPKLRSELEIRTTEETEGWHFVKSDLRGFNKSEIRKNTNQKSSRKYENETSQVDSGSKSDLIVLGYDVQGFIVTKNKD